MLSPDPAGPVYDVTEVFRCKVRHLCFFLGGGSVVVWLLELCIATADKWILGLQGLCVCLGGGGEHLTLAHAEP
jgi:hypothetical protein